MTAIACHVPVPVSYQDTLATSAGRHAAQILLQAREEEEKESALSSQEQCSVAAWRSDQDFVAQIAISESSAVAYTISGRELYRFSVAASMTADDLRTKIQERYQRMLEIALFADAEHLTPEVIVSESQQPILAKCSLFTPEMWVVRWIDFSSKYGVGYILVDNSIGIYFNDQTRIIVPEGSRRFDYTTRRTMERPSERTSHSLDDYPAELRKKVTLYHHFEKALLTGSIGATSESVKWGKSSLSDRQAPTRSLDSSSQLDFVQKMTKDKHAITFFLSNTSVQIAFFDNTEMLVSPKRQAVTCVNAEGEVCSYLWSQLPESICYKMKTRLAQCQCYQDFLASDF
jgi:hypothetical protein